jgi:hypothetical protein
LVMSPSSLPLAHRLAAAGWHQHWIDSQPFAFEELRLIARLNLTP